jgi:hypothetical protein
VDSLLADAELLGDLSNGQALLGNDKLMEGTPHGDEAFLEHFANAAKGGAIAADRSLHCR